MDPPRNTETRGELPAGHTHTPTHTTIDKIKLREAQEAIPTEMENQEPRSPPSTSPTPTWSLTKPTTPKQKKILDRIAKSRNQSHTHFREWWKPLKIKAVDVKDTARSNKKLRKKKEKTRDKYSPHKSPELIRDLSFRVEDDRMEATCYDEGPLHTHRIPILLMHPETHKLKCEGPHWEKPKVEYPDSFMIAWLDLVPVKESVDVADPPCLLGAMTTYINIAMKYAMVPWDKEIEGVSLNWLPPRKSEKRHPHPKRHQLRSPHFPHHRIDIFLHTITCVFCIDTEEYVYWRQPNARPSSIGLSRRIDPGFIHTHFFSHDSHYVYHALFLMAFMAWYAKVDYPHSPFGRELQIISDYFMWKGSKSPGHQPHSLSHLVLASLYEHLTKIWLENDKIWEIPKALDTWDRLHYNHHIRNPLHTHLTRPMINLYFFGTHPGLGSHNPLLKQWSPETRELIVPGMFMREYEHRGMWNRKYTIPKYSTPPLTHGFNGEEYQPARAWCTWQSRVKFLLGSFMMASNCGPYTVEWAMNHPRRAPIVEELERHQAEQGIDAMFDLITNYVHPDRRFRSDSRPIMDGLKHILKSRNTPKPQPLSTLPLTPTPAPAPDSTPTPPDFVHVSMKETLRWLVYHFDGKDVQIPQHLADCLLANSRDEVERVSHRLSEEVAEEYGLYDLRFKTPHLQSTTQLELAVFAIIVHFQQLIGK